MIPFPQHMVQQTGALHLTGARQIAVGDPALLPLARQLAQELAVLAKTRPVIVDERARPGGLQLDRAG